MDMDRASLRALAYDDLISLILAQAEVIAQQSAQIAVLAVLVESHLAIMSGQVATITRLEKRVAELEDKLGKPCKTRNNSALLPTAGQKPNLPWRERKGRNGRPGVNRAFTADPDHVIEALARQCPIGAAALGRVFETHKAILHACCDAWNWLIDQPHQITSIGQRKSAQVSQ